MRTATTRYLILALSIPLFLACRVPHEFAGLQIGYLEASTRDPSLLCVCKAGHCRIEPATVDSKVDKSCVVDWQRNAQDTHEFVLLNNTTLLVYGQSIVGPTGLLGRREHVKAASWSPESSRLGMLIASTEHDNTTWQFEIFSAEGLRLADIPICADGFEHLPQRGVVISWSQDEQWVALSTAHCWADGRNPDPVKDSGRGRLRVYMIDVQQQQVEVADGYNSAFFVGNDALVSKFHEGLVIVDRKFQNVIRTKWRTNAEVVASDPGTGVFVVEVRSWPIFTLQTGFYNPQPRRTHLLVRYPDLRSLALCREFRPFSTLVLFDSDSGDGRIGTRRSYGAAEAGRAVRSGRD